MKLPFKKGKEVTFQKVKTQQGFILENQDRKLTDIRDIGIKDYLEDMFNSADQFVSLAAPEATIKSGMSRCVYIMGKLRLS